MATVLASVAGAALLGLIVVALHSAILWFFISFFTAIVFNPAVERLSRRLPRGLSVALVVLAALGALAGLVVLLLPPFLSQVRELVERAPSIARDLGNNAYLVRLARRIGVDASLGGALKGLPDYLAGAAPPLLHFVGGVFRLGLAIVSIFFLVIFMLLGGPQSLRAGLCLLEPLARARIERLGRSVYAATTRYALGTCALALVAGVVAVVTLALAGVPYFLPLGVTLVVLDLIPFAGAITGGIILTLVTGATVGWLRAVVVLAVFTLYQEVESHVFLPLVHQRTVRVSALGIVIALLIGYELGGLFGVLFAVPVAGALRIVARELLALREEHRHEAGATGSPLPAPPRPREHPMEPSEPVEH